ncbi:hypothetical protein I5U69_13140 [Stenotrophomonas maltophilia]|nr:hypothetical protein [Stenotrophomonas maltophilia]MBH1643680.1 hypothetical protein [Stenotrophomonas maltophilia]
MSSKHTPAPWIVRFRADGSSYISMGDPSKGPHKAADMFLAADGGESDLADARLIAAAPELLAALVKAERLFREIGFIAAADSARPESLWNEINNAIAKATDGAQ